jgi:hypothetical protein
VSQTIEQVVPGQQYEAIAWYAIAENYNLGPECSLTVRVNQMPLGPPLLFRQFSRSGWGPHSRTWLADSTTAELSFTVACDAVEVFAYTLDRVSFAQVGNECPLPPLTTTAISAEPVTTLELVISPTTSSESVSSSISSIMAASTVMSSTTTTSPTLTNLIQNPGFEGGARSWTTVGDGQVSDTRCGNGPYAGDLFL